MYWIESTIKNFNYVSEPYKHDPHRWIPLGNKKTSLPWIYCPKCGLVKLKNKITNMCVKLGCNFDVHSDYLRWKKK